MSALVKNGDLVPDTNGFIEKNQTFEALLKVGIHHRIARETVDANFLSASCGTCPLTMDVFNMNTIRTGGASLRLAVHTSTFGALAYAMATSLRGPIQFGGGKVCGDSWCG